LHENRVADGEIGGQNQLIQWLKTNTALIGSELDRLLETPEYSLDDGRKRECKN